MYYEPIASALLGPCSIGGPTGATVYCHWWFVLSLYALILLTLLGCHLYKNECVPRSHRDRTEISPRPHGARAELNS